MSVFDYDGNLIAGHPKVRSAEAPVDMTPAEFRNWQRIFDKNIERGDSATTSSRRADEYVLALREAKTRCTSDDKPAAEHREIAATPPKRSRP